MSIPTPIFSYPPLLTYYKSVHINLKLRGVPGSLHIISYTSKPTLSYFLWPGELEKTFGVIVDNQRSPTWIPLPIGWQGLSLLFELNKRARSLSCLPIEPELRTMLFIRVQVQY